MGNLKQPLTTLHVQLGCIPGKESQNYETWNLYRVTGTSAFQRERDGEREGEGKEEGVGEKREVGRGGRGKKKEGEKGKEGEERKEMKTDFTLEYKQVLGAKQRTGEGS